MNQLIILTGQTASGKDTIMRKILDLFPQMKKVITTTSRKIREHEQNGKDYNFISEEEFKEKIKASEFIEWVEYGGNFYGTEKKAIESSLDQDAIWRIDPSRAGRIKQLLDKTTLEKTLVIYLKISEEVARERLKARSLSDEEIEKRLTQDTKDWAQFKDAYDYIVDNIPGKLDETVSEIIQIIEAHKRKLSS